MELGSGLDLRAETYNDYAIKWYNLPYFSRQFLSIVGALHEFDVERINNNQELSKSSEIRRATFIEELQVIYRLMFAIRLTIRANYESNETFRKWFDIEAAKDSIFYINAICYTFDPRLTAYGIPGIVPLILYPSQEKFVRTIEQCYDSNQKLYTDKSRAEGASEIACAWTSWLWKYKSGVQITWVSRVLTAVDNSDDPDALFTRIKRFIYSMPRKMLPTGYSKGRRCPHMKFMRIINPDNGSTIKGAGGEDPGRGGRSSIIFVDEFASLQNIVSAQSSLNENGRCHIYITTPKGQNGAYDVKTGGKTLLFSLWWYCNPSKNPDGWHLNERPKDNFTYWREWKNLTDDEFLIRQEIEIDYTAFVDGVIIPREWVTAAINFECGNDGDVAGGLDLAGGGQDLPVLAQRRGIRLFEIEALSRTYTPLQQARIGIKRCEENGAIQLAYDKVGYGSDVVELRSTTNLALEAIVGQAKPPEIKVEFEDGDTADLVFGNYRAFLWWTLRIRFKKTYQHVNNIKRYPLDELISIKSHSLLVTELSTPLVIFRNGKIYIESKESMKSRNIKSPNYADACAYAYAPIRGSKLIKIDALENIGIPKCETVVGFCYTSWHYDSASGDMYCVYTGLDWNKKQLIALKEFYFPAGTDPTYMLEQIKDRYENFDRVEHLINEEFFKDISTNNGTQRWIDYKNKGLGFIQNWRYEPQSDFLYLNKMSKENMLKVCKDDCETLYTQCVTCRKEDFYDEKRNRLAIAFLNLISYILFNNNTSRIFKDILYKGRR